MSIASTTQVTSQLAIARLNATHDRVILPTRRTFARARVAAVLPIFLASALVFGWRALLLLVYTLAACWAARRAWRWLSDSPNRFGAWRASAVLLALALPTGAAVLPFERVAGSSRFVVPAAALLFFLVSMIRSRIRLPIIEPVIVTVLLLHVLFPTSMSSRRVLAADMLGIHNLFDESRAPRPASSWRGDIDSGPVIERTSAMDELDQFMKARHDENSPVSVRQLLLEKMPPLEDLVIGGHPAPMGQVGVIYALAGALVLAWRGVTDLRTPVLFLLGFYVAVLLLPIPGVIWPDKIDLAWPAMLEPNVGIEAGLTFANYVLLASPATFVACFVATLPTVAPIARGARIFWAPLAGIASAIATLYFNVAAGAYLALLIAGMLSPWFDWMFGPRPRRRLNVT